MTPEYSLALSLIAAQQLQTPETLQYVREQEASYLTLHLGLDIVSRTALTGSRTRTKRGGGRHV